MLVSTGQFGLSLSGSSLSQSKFQSLKRKGLKWLASLLTETSRVAPGGFTSAAARSRGRRSLTRRKWPRWLVPRCVSIPSAVSSRSGFPNWLPALVTTMSILRIDLSSSISFAARWTSRSEARSSSTQRNFVDGYTAEICLASSSTRALSRPVAIITDAPPCANARAVASPMPPGETPVIRIVLPVMCEE